MVSPWCLRVCLLALATATVSAEHPADTAQQEEADNVQPLDTANSHVLMQRNFLRFGKRAYGSMKTDGAEDVDATEEDFEGFPASMHSYNKRSFLRFGKRSSPLSMVLLPLSSSHLAEADEDDVVVNKMQKQHKRRDDFLRFGKRAAALDCAVYGVCPEATVAKGKKSNDFLRFG